jgi:hypothetical protein
MSEAEIEKLSVDEAIDAMRNLIVGRSGRTRLMRYLSVLGLAGNEPFFLNPQEG